MTITDPDHWKEPGWDKGPKYDKIVELLAELNKHTLNVQFFYGTFVEKFDAVVTSDGATVTMSLELAGGGDLTMVFSDGHTALDTSPAVTIALTTGSDSSPQPNWIYIPLSTKVLTKSTTAWPSAEHIKIGYFLVPSAGFVQTNGVYVNQNWNDGTDVTIKQGHLTHMAEKIRNLGSTYFSGVDGNGTTDYLTIVGAVVDFKSTVGIVDQMHMHTFPAHDTSAGDLVLVKNESGNAYNDGTNLYTLITNDSTGAAIGLNNFFNLVFWGVVNKTGEFDSIICNLPGGTYNTLSQAENDASGFDDFSIPREFSIDSGTGFLICRMTIQNVVGSWTHISTTDLRGTTPSSATGGAGAVTNEFVDNVFRILDESDPTKQIAFEASGITTATTRTLTVPDASGTLALTSYVDAHLMIGTSNSAWTNTSFWIEYPRGEFISQGGTMYNASDQDCFGFFYLDALPLVRGGLDLWIKGIRLGVFDADGNNYITRTRVFGIDYNSITSKYEETADLDTPAEYYSGDGTMAAMTPFSCSGFRQILVIIDVFATTEALFDIVGIELECYYA